MEFQPPVWESLDGSPVPDGMGLEEYLSTRSENHGTPTRAAAHLAEGCFVRENGDWLYVDSIDWHEDGVTTVLVPVNKPSRKTTLQYPRRERVETVSKYPEDLSREMAWTQTAPASDVDVLVEDPSSHDDPLAAFIAETVESVAVEFIGSDRAPPVNERQDINSGHCGAVVDRVLNAVEASEFDALRVDSLFHGGMNVLHYWIQYETPEGECYHFDAEAPWGIRDWEKLPLAYRITALRGGEPDVQLP